MKALAKTLTDAATRMICRTAEITAITDHSPNFRSIELVGNELRGVNWNVGDKLQIRTDPDGFAPRTYTPTTWDPASGTTRLLTYMHSEGPGSTWARTAAVGDRCQFFGPRRSLELNDPTTPLVLVGDETSFALVAAWHGRHPQTPPVATLFEVSDPVETRRTLDATGVSSARIFARTERSSHLEELSATLTDLLATHRGAALCLTGKAQTIALLRRSIKQARVGDRTTRVKAYWDENRSGLD
jgi:ferric-chelate reductase (NADPH)